MALSNKEKTELMKKIDRRFEREKNNFESEMQEIIDNGKFDIDVLYNKVKQYEKVVRNDLESIDELDDELLHFFAGKLEILRSFYKKIYMYKPNLFKSEVEKQVVSIAKSYDICVTKLNDSKVIENNLNELINKVNKLYAFVNVYNDDELKKSDIILNTLESAFNFIEKISEEITNLRTKNNKRYDINYEKKENSNETLDNYISNLSKARSVILSAYPDKEKVIDDVLMYLNDLKGKYTDKQLKNLLMNIKDDLLKDFNYDIENNTLKEKIKGDNSLIVANPNFTIEDNNNFISLIKVMEDYYNDLKEKQIFVVENGKRNGSSLSDFVKCDDELKNLIKKAKNREYSYKQISDSFYNIVDYMKNTFGYVYKQEVVGRKRKVISVKRIGLGTIGLLFGAYGISALISEALSFSSFGFLYPSAIQFVLPSILTLISVVALKKALSSKEKGLVKLFIEKLKNKYEESLLEDDDLNGVRRR